MMKHALAGIALSVFLGLGQLPARGDVITTLFSTGQNNLHQALPFGVPDPHYTITYVGAGTPTITNGSGGQAITIQAINAGTVYAAPPPNTNWIAPTANDLQDEPVGNFLYSTTFTIGVGQLASTANISGRATADNQITDIILNGHSLGITLGSGSNSFMTLNALSISSPFFQQGLNTLTFQVANTPQTGGVPNPSAFVADLNGTVTPGVAVPEPSVVVLGGLGSLLLVGYRRFLGNRRSAA